MTTQNSKFNFNLTKASIYQAVRLEPFFKAVGIFKKLFFIFSVFGLLLFFFGFSPGFSLIFLIFFLVSQIKESFFSQKLKNPKLRGELKDIFKTLRFAQADPAKIFSENFGGVNLAEFLSFEAAKVIWKAEKFIKRKELLNSSVLFYFLLVEEPRMNFVFSRAILNKEELIKELKFYFGTYNTPPLRGGDTSAERTCPPGYSAASGGVVHIVSKKDEASSCSDFQEVIFEALKIALEKGHQRIKTTDILLGLAKQNYFFKEILVKSELNLEDIENLVDWQEKIEQKIIQRKRFWDYKNLTKLGSLARDWAAGYTITLDKYSTDWTEKIKKTGFSETIAHTKELETVERILSQPEINNVLLIGQVGTGRKGIIYGLTERCLSGQSLPELNYKRIKELNLPSLLAKISDPEEVEAVLDRIFQETATAGNVILVIDEFHNYIGTKTKLGVIDISGLISPYLHLPQFQIIAITSFEGLHKVIEQNPSILELFGKVEVSEVSKEDTLKILESLVPGLERKYKIFISYPAIKKLIYYSDRYIPNIPFPKKAIDILDELTVYISTKKFKVVRAEDVAKIITEKVEIPVGELRVEEKELLLNLEELIHQRIINQEEAVKELSSAMRRAKAEISIRKGPLGAFLFLGPTGVGKTETSKALAEIYFGSEEKMIRLDMSEFQNISDVPRLLGSPGEEGLLTTSVREKPFSLVLLDELEKAHSNILNLFLQVLDEGHLTDGLGRKVDFKNTIIICTSNAGSELIWKEIRENKKLDIIKEDLLSILFEKGIFRPEFINRFDGVVIFKPLTKENLLAITGLMLKKLAKNLQEKGIEFVSTEELKKKIVELGYSPVFGAREIRRVIQDRIENVLAKAILSGELKRGEKVEILPEEFRLSKI